MDGPRSRGYGARSGYDVRPRRLRGSPEGRDGVNRDVHITPRKIEVEHEGSCFGCNRRNRTADRPRRPGERPFRRCRGSLEGPRPCPWVVALFEYLQLVAYCNRQIAETKRSAL